jgi:hypothetical protein
MQNLENIAGLEDNIMNIDMTLMFLSTGYFNSWNCLREVRQATFVHAAGMGALGDSSSAAAAIAERRRAMGVRLPAAEQEECSGGSSIVLVREAEVFHGAVPVAQLLAECPRQIGCSDHVTSFNSDCAECRVCSMDIKAALAAQAKRAGVIDWMRAHAFKMVSLKQIVQQMLAQPDGMSRDLTIPGELTSKEFVMPEQAPTQVLFFSDCCLGGELPDLLQAAVPNIELRPMAGDVPDPPLEQLIAEARYGKTDTRLLVVVHDGCFKDGRVVGALKLALENKIAVSLLHEADADFGGCDFGAVMSQCPPALKSVRGFDGMRLFDAIAVQWSRGGHQPVSLQLLAMSLGAVLADKAQGAWGGAAAAFHQRASQVASAMCGLASSLKPRARTLTELTGQDSSSWKHIDRAAMPGGAMSDLTSDDIGWDTFGEAAEKSFKNPLHAGAAVVAAAPQEPAAGESRSGQSRVI